MVSQQGHTFMEVGFRLRWPREHRAVDRAALVGDLSFGTLVEAACPVKLDERTLEPPGRPDSLLDAVERRPVRDVRFADESVEGLREERLVPGTIRALVEDPPRERRHEERDEVGPGIRVGT